MEVRNKTKAPLRVPLPGGKQLHLGPGRSGRIAPKAADFAPLRKLVDDERLELVEGPDAPPPTGGSGRGPSGAAPSRGRVPEGGVRHTGDR